MRVCNFFRLVNEDLFGGRLSIWQKEGIEHKLKAFHYCRIRDERWKAYMLATSYHETGTTMCPVVEYGRGRGKPYGRMVRHDGRPYDTPMQLYYGRGDVQLTWYENYEKMGRLMGLPLLKEPDLVLHPNISAEVMIEGMTKGASGRGDFTGRTLEQFFNDRREDPVGARSIVNGRDRAEQIAGYYERFLRALTDSI